MSKQETIREVLISQLPFVKVRRLTAIAYEIGEVLFPVGGHHDHMCPCGRDWETKKDIALQIIEDYDRTAHITKDGEPLVGTVRHLSFWLERRK